MTYIFLIVIIFGIVVLYRKIEQLEIDIKRRLDGDK
jgi:hypothetical protein